MWLFDRFGNRGDVADHPIFDDVVLELAADVEPVGLARGALAPDVIEDDDSEADAIDDEDARSPESDDPHIVDDAENPPIRPIDPIEDVDAPAPIAARGSADGRSATPIDGSGGGGLMMLVLLVGWRRCTTG